MASGPMQIVPSSEELFELAYNYHYEHALWSFLLSIQAGRTEEHVNRYSLHAVIRGAYVMIKTGSDSRGPVYDAIVTAAGVAYQMLASLSEREGFSSEYYRASHMWGGILEHIGRKDEALSVVDVALGNRSSSMPYMRNAMLLLRLRLLQFMGRLQEAFEVADPLVDRPFLFTELNQIAELNDIYCRICMALGRHEAFRRVSWRGLRTAQRSLRVKSIETLIEFYGGLESLLAQTGKSPMEETVISLVRIKQSLESDRQGRRLLEDLNEWLDLHLKERIYAQPGAQHANYFTEPSFHAGSENRILITRAMGGIGDLLTITPGIRALRETNPEKEIVFAIPSGLVPLLEGNPHCTAIDISRKDLDVMDFGEWYNLSDCPAGREESRIAPHVTKSRIDIFATAMGIGPDALARMDHRPVYVIQPNERESARDFLKQRGCGPYVAVQFQSADSYKDYPHMERVVMALAEECDVLVFHDRHFHGFDHKRITKLHGMGLRRALALAGQCDVMLAPDSAFMHLAGALVIPSVVLFGPVDSRLGTRHYPLGSTVSVAETLPCVPCWRNEYSPCRLTGGRRSRCMAEIDPDKVIQQVRVALVRAGAAKK